MPLSTYVDRIQSILAKTQHNHNACPLAGLLRTGLKSIQDHRADYDAIVDERNPFYQEFSQCAQCGAQGDGDWFSLFECLVIFIRMRQMANRRTELSTEENAVLEYFEKNDEWGPQDNKVVCAWYWHRIPSGEV